MASSEEEHGAKLLSDNLASTWHVLVKAYSELSDEDGELPDTPFARELEEALSGGLRVGQRVRVAVFGTGQVFPEGLNVRRGTVLKHGQTEFAWLVEVDEPVGEDKVLNLPAVYLAPLEPEDERIEPGHRSRPSSLA